MKIDLEKFEQFCSHLTDSEGNPIEVNRDILKQLAECDSRILAIRGRQCGHTMLHLEATMLKAAMIAEGVCK
jgi:hypothetical protein